MYNHGRCSSDITDDLHALGLDSALRIYEKIGDHGCDESQLKIISIASNTMEPNRPQQQYTLITIELARFLAWCRGHQTAAQAWCTRSKSGRRIARDDDDAHPPSAKQIAIMQVRKVLCHAFQATLQTHVDIIKIETFQIPLQSRGDFIKENAPNDPEMEEMQWGLLYYTLKYTLQTDATRIRCVYIPDDDNKSRSTWWVFCRELEYHLFGAHRFVCTESHSMIAPY